MAVLYGWQGSLLDVLNGFNKYHVNGKKVVSYGTMQKRKETLFQGFGDLREKFKFKTVLAFRGKHMEYLVQKWEQDGLSASSICNKYNIFKTFATWIGKRSMILPLDRYLEDSSRARRSYVAKEPKTWRSKGVDVQAIIDEVREKEPLIADSLMLQYVFGLRSKESLLLRPHLADKGNFLLIEHGPKGGRSRHIEIRNEYERKIIDEIKSRIPLGCSLIPKDKTLKQWLNHYYTVIRSHGIKRSEGITAHGLRHENLANLYKDITGHDTPVEGGNLKSQNSALDKHARQAVSERAGHSREAISSVYIGSKKKKSGSR